MSYSEMNGRNQTLMLIISLDWWFFSLDFTERVTNNEIKYHYCATVFCYILSCTKFWTEFWLSFIGHDAQEVELQFQENNTGDAFWEMKCSFTLVRSLPYIEIQMQFHIRLQPVKSVLEIKNTIKFLHSEWNRYGFERAIELRNKIK